VSDDNKEGAMRSWQKIALAAGVVLAAVGAGALTVACKTPIRIDAEMSGFGVEVKTTLQIDGTARNDFLGQLPAGKCLKITYRGREGEVTGTDTVSVPGSSQIPAGSTTQSFEVVDCRPPEEGGSGEAPLQAMSPATRLTALPGIEPQPTVVFVFGSPIVLDTVDGGIYRNAVYGFRVENAGSSAWDEILPVLVGGPGTPIPPGVEVISFTQTIPDRLGARMIAADTAPFAEFRLDWNGTHGYADLASGTNVVQYAAPNGWSVVETFVSALDVLPFGQQNVATTTRRTVTENASSRITGKILYHP
jgi:hypothetical protein